MAEDTVRRVIDRSSLPSDTVPDMPLVGHPSDASMPVSTNTINSFAAPTDARVDNSFMPSFQGEAPTNNGTSNSRKINRIASHHAMAMELLQNRMSTVPTSSTSASWGFARIGSE
uniref:Basic leucine-zipper C-terminal domain-containing protein n=1 Tax=Arundo donax TaxID=35708 RepID=A0A0A8ZQK6_ARUDO